MEKNIRERFQDIPTGDEFLDKTPKAQATKAKFDKWHHIMFKNFCKGNDQ